MTINMRWVRSCGDKEEAKLTKGETKNSKRMKMIFWLTTGNRQSTRAPWHDNDFVHPSAKCSFSLLSSLFSRDISVDSRTRDVASFRTEWIMQPTDSWSAIERRGREEIESFPFDGIHSFRYERVQTYHGSKVSRCLVNDFIITLIFQSVRLVSRRKWLIWGFDVSLSQEESPVDFGLFR